MVSFSLRSVWRWPLFCCLGNDTVFQITRRPNVSSVVTKPFGLVCVFWRTCSNEQVLQTKWPLSVFFLYSVYLHSNSVLVCVVVNQIPKGLTNLTQHSMPPCTTTYQTWPAKLRSRVKHHTAAGSREEGGRFFFKGVFNCSSNYNIFAFLCVCVCVFPFLASH